MYSVSRARSALEATFRIDAIICSSDRHSYREPHKFRARHGHTRITAYSLSRRQQYFPAR
jgi:hypothetical protein